MIVEPVKITDEKTGITSTWYKIEVAVKNGVTPFSPFLAKPPLFSHSMETRDFILTKCMMNM